MESNEVKNQLDKPIKKEMNRAIFYRKPGHISQIGFFPFKYHEDSSQYCIKAEYEMSEEQFSSFKINLLEDQPFIEDFNKDNLMYRDGDLVENCIEVFCKESDFSLLVNSEGFRYARYVAVILNVHKKKTGLTKEQIEFLKSLQEELKTQETDIQADPRFWVVAQYEWVTVLEGCHDHYEYYDANASDSYNSWEELISNLKDRYEEDAYPWDEYEDYNDLPEELVGFITEVPVAKQHVIKENTFFLTKRECQEHIKRNHYHYNDTVHTYAMTAWRSPQVEKLIKILQEADFEEVKS